MKKKQQIVHCEICKQEMPKYRCPKCRILYCSVKCFKTHKEAKCVSVTEKGNKIGREGDMSLYRDKNREDGELSDDSSEEEATEDKVPLEKLQKLGDSQRLLQMLENPHLRSMMIGLVESHDPGCQMEAAMQEPIFTEFADECLDIIKEDNSLPKG